MLSHKAYCAKCIGLCSVLRFGNFINKIIMFNYCGSRRPRLHKVKMFRKLMKYKQYIM